MNDFFPRITEGDNKNKEFLLGGSIPSLSVLYSDDPMIIGELYFITKNPTNIGRSSKNDIVFPDDSPVSRKHIILTIERDVCYLVQAFLTDINGNAHYPKYGTYINNVEIGNQPVLLNNGDEIRLGNRLRLKYEFTTNLQPEETIEETFGTIECDNETVELI